MKILKVLFTLAFLVAANFASSETISENYRPSVPDLAIPAAPAYQLLDANVSLVGRPGLNREFKVDWSLKSYRLSPNIALEAEPVWLIAYSGKKGIRKYRESSYLMQTLSTLSISAGTLDGNDTARFVSYAAKITLYRKHDPLMDEDLYKEYNNTYLVQLDELQQQLDSLKYYRKSNATYEQKDSVDALIIQKEVELSMKKKSYTESYAQKQEEYKARYWNATNVEIAYGRAHTFNPKLSDRIDSLILTDYGNAIWINGALGIGRHWLISAALRSMVKPGFKRTNIMDTVNNIPITTQNRLNLMNYAWGVNVRYGSTRYSFFIEGFQTYNHLLTAIQSNGVDTGNDREQVRKEFTLSYGGDLKLGRNVMLSYGIRTLVNSKIQMKWVVPIASVTCLMR